MYCIKKNKENDHWSNAPRSGRVIINERHCCNGNQLVLPWRAPSFLLLLSFIIYIYIYLIVLLLCHA